MKEHSSKHLTEEQFVEWASGERSDASAQHLRTCAECRDEVRELTLATESFKTDVHQHATALRPFSGAQIRALANAPATPPARWKSIPVPALAAIVLLAVMVYSPERPKTPPPSANTDAADNALLMAVSNDVYRTNPSALRPAAELNKERNQLLTSSQAPNKNDTTKEENR